MGIQCRWEENSNWKKMNISINCELTQTRVTYKSLLMSTTKVQKHEHTACIPLHTLYYTSAFHLNVSFICSPSFCRSRYSERSLYVWGSEWRVHWELQERSNSHLAVFWQRHRLFQTLPRFIHIGVSRMLVSPNSQHLQLLVSHASAQCWDNTNRAVDKHSATQAKRRTYTATDDAGNCLSNMMMTQSLP